MCGDPVATPSSTDKARAAIALPVRGEIVAAQERAPASARDGRGCKALTLSSRKAPAQGGKAGDNILTDIIRNGM